MTVETHFIASTATGLIVYLIFLIKIAKNNKERRQIFPFFLLIPFSIIIIPILFIIALLGFICFILMYIIPNFLFPDNKNKD